MNAMELVRLRKSVRSFDGQPLAEEDANKILDFARKVENPYAIPIQWKLLDAKRDGLSTPVITGTDTFIAGKVQPVLHAEEAFGYAFERIVLFAASLGIGTTWIAGTMDRPAFERAMSLEGNEMMPCISPLGYPAKKKSLKESMMRRAIKADSRTAFEKLFFDGNFDTPLAQENAGSLGDLLEMVRWAPSAVNNQPWRAVVSGNAVHFYKKARKGYVNERGFDTQKIDLGIGLSHFMLGLEERGDAVEFVLEDPGIAAPEWTEYITTVRFI